VRKSALLWFGLVVTVLVALGLVVLSSASEANAIRLHGDAYFFIKRQFSYLAVGLVLGIGVACFDYHNWREHPLLAWGFFLVIMVLLMAVFGFKAVNGSHRWISVGPLRLQPSEFAKLSITILLAVVLDRSGWRIDHFLHGALKPAALIGIIATPILFEPDFGSVMVVGAVGFLLMFVAGTKIIHMVPFALVGGAVVVFKIMTNANRMARLTDGNMLYQVKMALAAIGRGGIWGVGLNESMQKEHYLPEAHTDFIFAIGAEEFGLWFSLVVIVLYVLLFTFSIHIARKATDAFGRYLVIGLSFIIFFQTLFNLGVVSKSLPTKGVALPFFSYGGTNMLSAFICVGIILSVGVHSYRESHRSTVRKVKLCR